MTNQQLKELRESLGHSQITMAKALGMSRRQYQRYEKDLPVPESVDMRVLIAEMACKLAWTGFDNDVIEKANKYILKQRVE